MHSLLGPLQLLEVGKVLLFQHTDEKTKLIEKSLVEVSCSALHVRFSLMAVIIM